jgi:hypothetical protein
MVASRDLSLLTTGRFRDMRMPSVEMRLGQTPGRFAFQAAMQRGATDVGSVPRRHTLTLARSAYDQ